jgi:hypothetical protein
VKRSMGQEGSLRRLFSVVANQIGEQVIGRT